MPTLNLTPLQAAAQLARHSVATSMALEPNGPEAPARVRASVTISVVFTVTTLDIMIIDGSKSNLGLRVQAPIGVL